MNYYHTVSPKKINLLFICFFFLNKSGLNRIKLYRMNNFRFEPNQILHKLYQ